MTRLGDKISVPKLDEQRLARIESRVVAAAAALDLRPRPALPWLRAGVATLAIAGVAVAIALNVVAAQRPSGARAFATNGPPIVVTGPGERAQVELGDAVLSIGESSRVGIHRAVGGGVLIGLEAGEVACEVDERSGRAPFRLRAAEVTVTVVGTGFSVSRGETVRVAVEHGVVEVATPHHRARLERGERWEGSLGGEALVAGADDDDIAAGDDIAADPDIAADDVGADDGVDGLASAARASRHERGSTASHDDRDDRRAARPGRDRRVARPQSPGDAGAPKPVALPPPRASQRVARDAEIAALLRIEADDPERAARDFLTLAARRSGAVASFALYSRAYLLLARLADPRQAVETARHYEKRFPRGAEADAMHWIRIRGSCELGDDTGCRAAAYSYLRRFPQGRFAREALRITRR